ncbi:uncharacterized protein EDB91DRAFT_1112905 [Suillus paluster]|uniref:uncharacterized protein n=1 Tax=Suillus paluster TaxID=48578 RepID=UPI001B879FBB|nr:uncharacterized protein EDB91DRAFT_1112905 [Suillus paluster]KAG1748255.1 hypothetical protein EDB91DRAFT_1112905 [Suillus paluster]
MKLIPIHFIFCASSSAADRVNLDVGLPAQVPGGIPGRYNASSGTPIIDTPSSKSFLLSPRHHSATCVSPPRITDSTSPIQSRKQPPSFLQSRPPRQLSPNLSNPEHHRRVGQQRKPDEVISKVRKSDADKVDSEEEFDLHKEYIDIPNYVRFTSRGPQDDHLKRIPTQQPPKQLSSIPLPSTPAKHPRKSSRPPRYVDPARYSAAQYTPVQYSPAQHPPAQHPPAQYPPAQYPPTQSGRK